LREKKKLRAFDIKEKDILIHLADLEREVEKKRNVIDELEKKIVLAKSDLEELGEKLDGLGRSLEAAEIQLAKRLVALYKYARKGYVKMVATSGNLDQLWHRVKYIKAIVSESRRELVGLADLALKYEKQIMLVQESIAKTEAMKDKKSAHLSSLKKDLDKKVVYLVKIHIEKEFYETIVHELQIAARNLKQTMHDIETKKTYKLPRPSNFADAKGRLPLPLEGRIIRSDKRLGFEGMNLQKGIFIERSCDGKVRAVFSGRVDFSGKLKGYGEVIIINHGSRFFTISANLWQRKKNEGDVVEAGEVIGLAGHIGSSRETRLYFEIRRAGKKVDPLKWLKIN
jgi:septal ring factor EnvC (AmiA/AmiB activator)